MCWGECEMAWRRRTTVDYSSAISPFSNVKFSWSSLESSKVLLALPAWFLMSSLVGCNALSCSRGVFPISLLKKLLTWYLRERFTSAVSTMPAATISAIFCTTKGWSFCPYTAGCLLDALNGLLLMGDKISCEGAYRLAFSQLCLKAWDLFLLQAPQPPHWETLLLILATAKSG